MLSRRATAAKLDMVGGLRTGASSHVATPARLGADGVLRLHCVCGVPLGTTRRQAIDVLAFHRIYAAKVTHDAVRRTGAAQASVRTVHGTTTV